MLSSILKISASMTSSSFGLFLGSNLQKKRGRFEKQWEKIYKSEKCHKQKKLLERQKNKSIYREALYGDQFCSGIPQISMSLISKCLFYFYLSQSIEKTR